MVSKGTLTGMAVLAAKQVDKSLREDIADDIVDCIYRYAAGAVAASFVPVPGLDVALATADIWIMYTRINKHLGISFSENLMKSIGSAVIANLTANVGQLVIGSVLKFIPGIGSAIGGGLMAISVFGTTVAAGWVYLKALSKFYERGKSGDLHSIVDEVMRDNKEDIKKAFEEGKKAMP